MIVNEEDPVKAQLVNERISTAAGPGEPGDRAADRGRRRPLPQPPGRRRQLSACSARRSTSSACAPAPRSSTALRPALPPGPAARLARPGDPLRHPGPRQPRRRRPADRPARAADRSRQGGGQRAPPRRSKSSRSPSPRPSPWPSSPSCWSPARSRSSARRTPSPGSPADSSRRSALLGEKVVLGDGRRAGGDPADAGRACSSSCPCTGAASASGWWRSSPEAAALGGRRGGARGGGARGPRRLPARLHGHPAGRLPLADPLRRGRPGPLRRDQARHRALPVQAGAAGDDRRRSTRPAPASARRCCTWRS